jgi:hypothetical protein
VGAAAKIDGVLIRGRWIGRREIQRRMNVLSSLPGGASPARATSARPAGAARRAGP